MSIIGSPYIKSHSRSGASDREGLREYVIVYIVKSDPTDGAFIVGNAVGLPSRGSTYAVPDSVTELDVGATLMSIVPVPVGRTKAGKVIWEVTCTYSSKGLGGDPADEEASPLLRLTKRNWGTASYIHYPHKDLLGFDFVNTAGYPYDAVPVEETYVTLTIVKSEAAFNPTGYTIDPPLNDDLTTRLFNTDAAMDFQNAVNTKTFYGGSVGEVLCKNIRGTEEYENGIEYINDTYEFHFRKPDGTDPSARAWQTQLMDKGPYFFTAPGIDGGTKTAHSLDGTETTDDVKLNGIDGQKLDDDADAEYNLFITRKTADFDLLGV